MNKFIKYAKEHPVEVVLGGTVIVLAAVVIHDHQLIQNTANLALKLYDDGNNKIVPRLEGIDKNFGTINNNFEELSRLLHDKNVFEASEFITK